MKDLIQIFEENNLEEVDTLREAIANFRAPDETTFSQNLVEARWKFEIKEDEPLPPLNLLKFSNIFNLIEMCVERENFLEVRMARNIKKKPEGLSGYVTLFSFTQPEQPLKGEENFLFQLGDGKFLLTTIKTKSEKGIGRKFFEKFRIGEKMLFKNFEIEEIIYDFNHRYTEPIFSCSLIKGDLKEKKLDFLLIGDIQGCAITPRYQHTLFPQHIFVGGEPGLACEFYSLFLIIPSLFLLYTEELPVEKIKIPEINIKKFLEFVNFILSTQKKGMAISLIVAEREKLGHS